MIKPSRMKEYVIVKTNKTHCFQKCNTFLGEGSLMEDWKSIVQYYSAVFTILYICKSVGFNKAMTSALTAFRQA